MEVLLHCPSCKVTIKLGNTHSLPRSNVFMEQVGNAHHDHRCTMTCVDQVQRVAS
jgi:hypothetical protein